MNGPELDSSLNEMRARGVSIIDAIKFVRAEQGIGLGEAKLLVSQHSAYADIHAANEPLHDELIGYVERGLLNEPPTE